MNASLGREAKPNFALCAINATDAGDSHGQNLDKLACTVSRRHLLWITLFTRVRVRT